MSNELCNNINYRGSLLLSVSKYNTFDGFPSNLPLHFLKGKISHRSKLLKVILRENSSYWGLVVQCGGLNGNG